MDTQDESHPVSPIGDTASSSPKNNSSLPEFSMSAEARPGFHRHSHDHVIWENNYILDEKSLPQVHVTPEMRDTESYSTDRANSGRRGHFLLAWWQEVTACIIAVGAFFALFATLHAYNHKLAPDLPGGLSLNTILSLYVIVLEGAVLLVAVEGLGQLKWVWLWDKKEKPVDMFANYDDAIRRSKKGAFTLIWKLRLSHLLSSAGAAIIILALAISPLTQQIVEYENCEVSINSTPAALPRTNYYMQPGNRGAGHSGALAQTIEVSMQSDINAAMYNPSLLPTARCPSGNCTWSNDYSTVGYCSFCRDITDQLIITNTSYISASGQETYNITTALPYVNVSMLDNGEPRQMAAMGPSNGLNSADPPNYPGGTELDFVLAKGVMGRMDPATNRDWTDCGSSPTSVNWKCRGYGAARCTLYPCVKTYTASVKAGQLTEYISDTKSSDWGAKSPDATTPIAILDSKCVGPEERKNLTDLGYLFNNSTRWMAYNMTESPFENTGGVFPQSMIRNNCLYMMDFKFLSSLQGYLRYTLKGIVTRTPEYANTEPYGQFDGPQAVQSIYNFGEVSAERIEEFMNNISTVITNNIRTTGVSGFSKDASGDVKWNKTCIAVRWPYLAFPAAMTLFTVIFFVLMLIKTRPTKDRPEIWKSSTLPLLYQSLARDERASGADADVSHGVADLQQMQTFAKTRKITFKALMKDTAKGVVQEIVDQV